MADDSTIADLIDELRWRGLLHQCTDEGGLRAHLGDPANHPRRVYAGFDPTASSFTIGNLVPMMLLAHVKRSGHIAVALQGGGTGLIGDPSGKTAERRLNSPEMVASFVESQKPIFDRVLGNVDGRPHEVVNNLEWLGDLSYIGALRGIGKHFSVNMMMQKESVRARLENREQGISYTEFSYMILQAYDFAHMHENLGVTVQIGGSDQFGNIVAGTDYIRRRTFEAMAEKLEGASGGDRSSFDGSAAWRVATDDPDRDAGVAFGLTAPLVTKADGTKFGKTESGAVWLTADRTSPYAYYQFWLNATDNDAASWIKIFTFLDEPTIKALIDRHDANPGARELQRTLAQEATRILHGEEAVQRAESAAKALFSGEVAGLDEATLGEVFADVPSSEHAAADLDGGGFDPISLLKATGLASSNREAREFLANGSVSVNGEKINAETRLTRSHLLHGSVMAIRRGKKNWHMARWR